jgi:hypothetical protein
LFAAIADVLTEAQGSPYIKRLDLCYLNEIDNPLLVDAITGLLSCDGRLWDKLSIDECERVRPEFLIEVMRGNNIKSLHFTNNNVRSGMPDYCIHVLGDIIKTRDCLRDLRVTGSFTPSGAAAFADGLKDNHSLVRLDLDLCTFVDEDAVSSSSYSIGNATARALAVGLEGNQHLRTLTLSRCDLPDSSIEILLLALTQHPLTWLDLSNNHCGSKAISALASSIENDGSDFPSGSCLAGLTLTACGLNDRDIERLAMALRKNSTMKYLHIDGNRISDDGICLFAGELRNMKVLQTVWLMENEFGDEGAKSLLDALHVNVYLNHLGMDRHIRLYDDIQYWCSLNRGGRRLLAANAPLALWPLVLERCQHGVHYFREKRVGPADILYQLLHGPALFENHHR